MATRTRLNLYFDPALMPQIESLALRRKVSKSAIVEAAVMSYLSGDSADQLEAAMSRRLDKLGRQIDTLDMDLAVLGETVAQFIHFWLTITPPLSGAAQSAARAKGAERFEGFMQTLGRRLATGDRFLKELSRDIDSLHDDIPSDQTEINGDQI
ncbi:CopG family transcriptional regulator [Aquibaculum arenosum]|uniref:Ribbon-helix-helix domain-containing protein n=1 Tax=Aquibaculum arenosum TaxID=3032591 RepID=A0ABT5YJA2_9PROT|nr:CopG family transcriptional regulator [Fodinicurvata sp. CAU 1616]MDF2094923.1 ribbon-helix-helix domain-containing protein [Fodinicurvata sp. CAU 1616]